MFDFLRTFSKLKDKMPAYTTTAEAQNKALEAPDFFVYPHFQKLKNTRLVSQ